MHCRSSLSLAGVLLMMAFAGVAQSSETENGFRPLFDGVSLNGWQTTGNWLVAEDGTIRLEPRPGESGWKRFDAYLCTTGRYENFVLDLEFKIEKEGNSGVFVHVGDGNDPVKTGFEVQILDTYGKARPTAHDCGGIVNTQAPVKNMAKPAGQWNRYTITCNGNHMRVVFNGEEVIDLDVPESVMKDHAAKGYIAFQDEAKPVWYRNVRIKQLPASPRDPE